ncbi:PLP-dependent aminotransferase family protein [Sporolactobacillus terrae]|uniref:MocR-like pyridoxine biosynthesis transcription factor PdxR n=1 Tax=Sporolactobacillus terrae TaxID=269673 RepID=UPI001119B37D|nr:PLP-dependent aminotransferase family protein [Sporolactobacillus terrae]
MEIIPKLDDRLNEPLYLQLYAYFKREIELAGLPEQTRLPSIRYLADQLALSKTTVQMAYQQLLAEGYLESRPRSGYFVAKMDHPFLNPSAGSMSTIKPKQLNRTSEKAPDIDFFMSSIDVGHFPLNAWRKCEQKLFEDPSAIGYGAYQGEANLRELLAGYLHRSRGVQCMPEQIVIAAGTPSILVLLYQLIDWKTGRIAMEDPGYQGVRRSLQKRPIQMVPISVEKDGLSIKELTHAPVDAVYITPSHQYPLGMVMPIANRIQLLDWAKKHARWIIEDDYDGEFRYRGKPIPSLQGIDEHNRVIYIGTFSKSLMPAIRISYMVLPPELLGTYRQLEWRQSASRLHQQTLALFMRSGQWEQHIRKMRTLYKKKQALLLNEIQSVMGDHCAVSGQDAGLHIVLHVKSKVPAAVLIKKAKSVGVLVYGVSAVRNKKEHQASILLGYGGLSTEEIKKGIQRLHQAWLHDYQ